MKRYRNKLLCTLLALAGLGATAAPAQAGSFVSGFNGNVAMNGTAGTPGAVVSYAVIDTGANGANAYLTNLATNIGGGATVDTLFGANAGRYVYLYEVVNTSTVNLGTLGITANTALLSSAGQITKSVFTNKANGGGDVGPKDKGFLYTATNSAGGNQDATATGQNSFVSNGSTTSITPDSAAGVQVDPGALTFLFRTDPARAGTDILRPGNWTDLLFVTSDYAPIWTDAEVHDTNKSANGNVPIANPEPQTYALMSTGLLGLAAWAGWRRRVRTLS